MPVIGDRMSESDDSPYAAILAADDWRPMAEYTADGKCACVKGYEYMSRHPSVGVARRGRDQLSY
jgi:hypothetical protein